jgi:hypothetical protein
LAFFEANKSHGKELENFIKINPDEFLFDEI